MLLNRVPCQASKAPTVELGIKPVQKESSVTFQLEDISTCDDSSWRGADRTSIDGHKEVIKAGKYGDTVLQGPTYLHGLTSGIDGKQLLNDGKQITIALQETKKEAQKIGDLVKWALAVDKKLGGAPQEEWAKDLEDLPVWLVPDLLQVII